MYTYSYVRCGVKGDSCILLSIDSEQRSIVDGSAESVQVGVFDRYCRSRLKHECVRVAEWQIDFSVEEIVDVAEIDVWHNEIRDRRVVW